jgi:hypothetical protein
MTLCRVAKFNGVHSIDMHFTGNFGADFTEISFIGLKGEFNEVGEGGREGGRQLHACLIH